MMGALTYLAPPLLMGVSFAAAVSAGASFDGRVSAPFGPIAALLAAVLAQVLQALLWVHMGVQMGGLGQ